MYNYESLTPRQKRILQLSAYGKKDREIGRIINIAPATVRTHKVKIFDKLGINSMIKALLIYWINNVEELKSIKIEDLLWATEI